MSTGLFAVVNNVVQEIQVELWDYTDDRDAVWRVTVDGDIRFIEGRLDEDIQDVIERAIRAYDEE